MITPLAAAKAYASAQKGIGVGGAGDMAGMLTLTARSRRFETQTIQITVT